MSQSPSSVSAALLGLSGLASAAGDGAGDAWDASTLLSAARPPKGGAAGASSQRGEKRRRQTTESLKPFNDDALREAVRSISNRQPARLSCFGFTCAYAIARVNNPLTM